MTPEQEELYYSILSYIEHVMGTYRMEQAANEHNIRRVKRLAIQSVEEHQTLIEMCDEYLAVEKEK